MALASDQCVLTLIVFIAQGLIIGGLPFTWDEVINGFVLGTAVATLLRGRGRACARNHLIDLESNREGTRDVNPKSDFDIGDLVSSDAIRATIRCLWKMGGLRHYRAIDQFCRSTLRPDLGSV